MYSIGFRSRSKVPTIREKARSRKVLHIWLPTPVHEALIAWLGDRDQTIQGTVRRLLEAEIGYVGPPSEDVRSEGEPTRRGEVSPQIGVTPGFGSQFGLTRHEPTAVPVKRELVRLTPEDAAARYLAGREKGYSSGKAYRCIGSLPIGWAPPPYQGKTDPETAKQFDQAWDEMEAFEYWYRRGDTAIHSWERASGRDGETPPPTKTEWDMANRRAREKLASGAEDLEHE
jgi:hypothetical protein